MAKRQLERSIKDGHRIKEEDESENFQFLSEFISPSNPKPLKMIDVISGSTKHLNLKHLSRLELQLHDLFKTLNTVYINMDTALVPHVVKLKNHSKDLINEALTQLLESMNSLTSLSCLLPSAPLPPLTRLIEPGHMVVPTTKEFLDSLSITPGTKEKLEKPIQQFLKIMAMDRDMYLKSNESLEQQVAYHKQIYHDYVLEIKLE